MPAIKYWDVGSGTWKQIQVATGPQGATGATGAAGDPATNLVTAVNSQTGNVKLTKADIVDVSGAGGLNLVDNTPDATKPLSADAVAALANKADSPTVTRTMSYSNGGLGGSVATSLSSAAAGGFRMVVKLPVTTSQWRIKIRHYDATNGATKQALTITGLIHGDHDRAIAVGTAVGNQETGNFVGNAGTPITPLGTTTIPGDNVATGGTNTNAGWYTSPWVTTPGDQFDAGVEHLIGISWTSTATAIQCAAGQAWYWNATNPTYATDASRLGSTATNQNSYVPLDWVIEYQSTSKRRAFLFVGDSICEGIAATRGAALTPTALWRNYPWQWAAKNNALVTNLSVAGIGAVSFTNIPALWNRQDLTQHTWDGAVIAIGTNDIFNVGAGFDVVAGYLMLIIAQARSVIGAGKPIYLVNLIARGISTSAETTNRYGLNQWIAQYPTGVFGVIDADGATMGQGSHTTSPATASTTMPFTMGPPYAASDGIHPSHIGQVALANACATGISNY